ncbi:MAG TPA: ABC transporter substrate-binding protein [Chloroflexota bacterium]|jgi:ABC-type nitrate/sulfonate/bicarbonate transport system substrate-binding protein
MSAASRLFGVVLLLGVAVACAAPPRPQASGAASSAISPAPSPAPAPRHLTIGISSSDSSATLWTARDAGVFTRYGLDVEVPYLSGVKAVQSLVAHQTEYGLISGRTTSDAYLAGADITLLAGLSTTLTFQMYAMPGFTQSTDLRGQTIGVTQLGASTDFAARQSLRRYGMEADRDYSLFQTGGTPESLAALQSGGVQAAVLSSPTTIAARRAGLPMVLDVGELHIPYASGALAVNRDFLAQEPETNRAVLKAIVEAIHYAKTHPAETKEIAGRYLKTTDEDVLQETYDLQVQKNLQRVPYVSLAGIQTVLDTVADENPRARELAPETLVDDTLLKELEASGFIKQLWGE